MLVWLKCRPLWVVEIRRACVLDMGSQHMRDVACGRELDESTDTLNEGSRVAHVESVQLEAPDVAFFRDRVGQSPAASS